MKIYIEITLLPSIEIPLYFLWKKVYQQIHIAFVENKNSRETVSVGSAFPEYNSMQNNLGSKLRLFAPTEKDLLNLNLDIFMFRLKDYIHISKIRNVPEHIENYGYFKRIQTKSSNPRLARRKSKREGISYEEALSFLDKRDEKISRLPYIQMESISSKQKYRLLIDFEIVENSNGCFEFGTYGLSSKCSVPIF